MKNKLKRLLSLVVALVMIVGMFPIFASAASISGGTLLYLSPNSNWTADNARFAAYFFGDGDAWVNMTDSNYDGVYECTSPAGKNFTNIIFCRMNPANTTNSWGTTWNQTNDLTYDGSKNLYTVAEGAWSYGSGAWSVYTDPVYVVAGVSTLCGEAWAAQSAANTMAKNADGLYEKVYENVAAGTYEYKVVRNGSVWFDNSTGKNCSVTVSEPSNITIKFDPATQKITHEIVIADTATVSTLSELLAALGNDNIKTIVVNGQIEVAEDTTLNLGGKTICGTHAAAYSMIHVQNGATLTIEGDGKITYAPGGNNTGAAIWVEGGLVQNGGEISITGSWTLGFSVDLRPNAWGTAHTEPAFFEMNDGSIVSTDTAVRVTSNSSDAYEELGVTFTMNGGKIDSTWDAIFVQHTYEGDLDILVKDGEISGSNSTLRIYANAAGSDIDMDIQGGTFTGATKVADVYADADPITITGGTFDTDVSAYVADGFELTDNGDGTYGVIADTATVSTLSELLAALGNDNIKTIVVNGQIEVAEDTTLNLGGKTICGTHAAAYSMIHVQNGATLTIEGDGKITYAPGGNNTGAAIWVEGGLVQNGGDISATGTWSFGFAVDLRPNAWGTAHTEPASFVMNAGSLSSTDTAIRVASNSSDAYEEMGVSFTMNGGKITSDWDAIFVQHLYEGDLDVLVKDGEISGANSTLRIYADVAGSDVDMDIQGGTFTGVMKVADAYATADPIVITGGAFDTDVSAYVADGYEAVANEDGTFHVGEIPPAPAAMIGSVEYATFAEALDKVQDGEVITLTDGVTGDESGTEINFEKDITFTITGNAPDYALPVITFQNATVNIEDAEILIPELDARQNATINVIDSIVHDAGGNSIVKSYYNGAINISGTSVVHAMQVTTMGYITVSGSAKLNATWQTNVYGNGLITLEDDATFATAALHLTAKEYSGRDNTDADRVGKPATIVVDGANFTVGKVYSDSGADYSYNSSKGINIGTLEGKSALLDIKNGANVTIFMANGEKAIVGKDGSVKLDSSSFQVACRGAEGTVTLEIADETFDVYGESTLNIPTLSGELYLQNGATVKDSTVGGSANIYGEVTFSGDNTFAMLSDFGAYYCGEPGAHWTVAEGGSLTLTQLGSNRYGLGYGDKVTVYGEIEDALTARDGLTDADADLNIYNGLVGMTNSGFKDTVNSFAAENAYVIFGVEGDKSFGNKFGNYWANYTYDFDNCVITANAFKFYEANSVSDLNVAKSDLYVNGIFMTDDADSEFTFTDSVIYSRATSNGTDDKNQNAGELTLVRSSLTYNAPFTNNGTLNLGEGSSLSAPSISGNGKIVIDGAKLTAESTPIVGNASDFTGTIEVINNDGLVAQIDKDGNVVLVALVAEVGGETFTSLADAIAAAGADDVITLLNNVTLPEAISIAKDKTVSIDLAGYTVSYTSNVPGEDMISNHGTLIIDDSSENGTGKITYLNTDTTGSNVTVSTITNDFGGVLTVEGGTIENTSSAAKAWTGEIFPFAIDNVTNSDLGPAVTTINGGKIVSNYRSIRLFANGATDANTVEINGGTMVGQVWLQSSNNIQNKASLTITGGSFQPAGNDGSSVYITTASSKEVDVAVSGGTFKTKIGIDNTANVSGVITGGTFTAAAKNGTNEALLARGFQFVESENGSFSPEFVPSGTFMGGFVNMADPEEVFISTEIRDLNAAESVVLKIYDENDTLLTTTTLLKEEYFVSDVLSVKTIITGDSSSWNTEWEDTMPRSDYVPAYGVLFVDGTETSRADIAMESAEDVPCDWAKVPGVTLVCDIVGHVDENKDHSCDICLATSECADADENHECDVCGENVGKHEAAEGSHICDYCKESASECADDATDGDHKCDICGEAMEGAECTDTDKNHKCDDCKADMGKHEDTDKDHDCEYGCSETIGSCEDKDNNGECDYGCDKEFEVEPEPTEPEETEPEETEPEETEPTPTDPEATEPEATEPEETEPNVPAKSIVRLTGKDRFETSLMAADLVKKNLGVDKFDAVILASGANFADALAGSYLATAKNAPILLTYKAEQNAAVVNYVKANLKAGGTVYILGGTSAVDGSLDSMLAEFNVNRLAGKDRFDTNLLILKEAGIKAGDEILVCTSTEFADALSVSAVGKPILLVHNEKSKLYDNQKELLATLNGSKFCIIGGKNAISADMEGLVKAYGTTERLAGANRLATSVMVAERFFSNAKDAVVAYGWNYPDGLCGGPLAFTMGAPVILAYNGYAEVSASFVAAKGISSGVVLGGEGLVSDATVDGIFAD